MKDQNHYFSTTSLPLAAAIVATSTTTLSHFEWHDTKARFIFEHSPNLNETIQLFWQRNLAIDALTYFEALRFIKNRMYEERDYGITR